MKLKNCALGIIMSLFSCTDTAVDPWDDGRNGGRCVDDAGCDSEFCLTTLKDGYELPFGLCTSKCTGPDDCTDIEHCVEYTATREHFCVQRCFTHEQCRISDGYTCQCLTTACTLKGCIPGK